MSMLTEQCAKLRKTAKAYEDVAPNTAALMREAADTIMKLRNRLTERGMCDTDDYVCPQCGTVMDYITRGDDDEKVIPMDDYVIPLHYCPSCGAEVVE